MNLKIRLSVLTFLEFGVWGAYLTCMGNYLGVAGLGAQISWFYAIQGIVAPKAIGHLSSSRRWFHACFMGHGHVCRLWK